ncbi:hypothetical protein NONI108955_20170 [Nocardia ninae]|uniref:Uncharacterized protein n=1 Tax=Nocardia ninae NBRC 108245 TaxID=1210091 RepID=A0A511MDV4_9NOCA|nr:hypothetical protein NN4_27970 [Nocardia ninae NBRC 108245]
MAVGSYLLAVEPRDALQGTGYPAAMTSCGGAGHIAVQDGGRPPDPAESRVLGIGCAGRRRISLEVCVETSLPCGD